MTDKSDQLIIADVKSCLRQIALELHAAAEGANHAADGIPSREASWGPVQQMYTRLAEATRLVEQFKTQINDAIEHGRHRSP